jgi:hypothetical protein
MRAPQSPVDDLSAASAGSLRGQRNFSGTLLFNGHHRRRLRCRPEENPMNGIIYIIGLIVVVLAILSFLGLR